MATDKEMGKMITAAAALNIKAVKILAIKNIPNIVPITPSGSKMDTKEVAIISAAPVLIIAAPNASPKAIIMTRL